MDKKSNVSDRTKIYRENQKNSERERRRKVKDALKEGREDSLNLAFLRRIMRTLGVNGANLARAMGKKEQTVHWWLAVDDTNLSNVEVAVQAMGYRINCSFEPETGVKKSYKIIIDGLELLSIKTKKGILEDVAYSDRRLAFLAKAMLDDGRRLSAYGVEGHPYVQIYDYFKKDDLPISALYRFAGILDKKVVWTLERDDGGGKGGHSGPQRIYARV